MKFEKLLIDFLEYLRKEQGFLISEETASTLLVYFKETNVDIFSEDEMMNAIRSFVCTSPDQYLSFPEFFRSFYHTHITAAADSDKRKNKRLVAERKAEKLRSRLNEIKSGKKDESRVDKLFSSNKKRRESLLRKTGNDQDTLKECNNKTEKTQEKEENKASPEKLTAKEKKQEELREKVEQAIKEGQLTKETEALANKLFFDESFEDVSDSILSSLLKNLQDFIKKTAFKAALAGDKEFIGLLKEAKDTVDEAAEKIKEDAERNKKGIKEEEAIQNQLDALLEEINALSDEEGVIEKLESQNHRNEFIGGKHAIKCADGGEIDLNRSITSLNQEEIKAIEYYVKKNARFFKTRISRNIQTRSHLKYDMKNIIKKACATDGVPIRLYYKKPVENKPKLTLILDISGSCSSASKLMLTFMYYLKQVFSGGCNAYVFVNSLHDVSEFMNSKSPEEAIDAIMRTVPTRGVYSDYYTPLKTFYEKKMSTITKDSIVIFIGDARNNKNSSGKEYIKAISRKARGCFWLNTEESDRWNSGDSIIKEYKEYMEDVRPVITINQLIDFITEFKVKKGK